MPNWCYNGMNFESAEDCGNVAAVMTNDAGELDFSALIPEPSDLEDSQAWRQENWGTSWNIGDTCVYEDNIWFESAWDAPLPVYRELVRRLPDVSFVADFNEEGAAFAGAVYAPGDGTAVLVCREFEFPEEDDFDGDEDDYEEERESAWEAFCEKCVEDAKADVGCESLL